MLKMRLRPGLRPGPAKGAYSASIDPLAGFVLPLGSGEGTGGEGKKGHGRARKGRAGDERIWEEWEGPLKLRIPGSFYPQSAPGNKLLENLSGCLL